ncbi:hypothetical protein BD311DRAFT_666116 [Dichomitus squalens]|uniref:Transcription factor TFIIIC triple barrel domain-containing protein n=1 Tax=Dichomitus squalens TaxID=114155 RepID=A0A4V2K007_9APHY|nr:hypothetical protein BD311DRAFT_666116 [Dichomitus squalens]
MAGLFPGYKHVETFGPDCEYEDEEEVEYVTLDLGTVEPTLVPSSSSYRLVGLDSATPFLQLSGTMLMGEHVSLLGTELLFAEGPTAGTSAGVNSDDRVQGKKSLVHVANTERRIRFKEVELKAKLAGAPAPSKGEGAATPAAKTSHLAKKVRTQMEHVMGGSAGPSRRGRGRGGGRKRGSTKSKAREGEEDASMRPEGDDGERRREDVTDAFA